MTLSPLLVEILSLYLYQSLPNNDKISKKKEYSSPVFLILNVRVASVLIWQTWQTGSVWVSISWCSSSLATLVLAEKNHSGLNNNDDINNKANTLNIDKNVCCDKRNPPSSWLTVGRIEGYDYWIATITNVQSHSLAHSRVTLAVCQHLAN